MEKKQERIPFLFRGLSPQEREQYLAESGEEPRSYRRGDVVYDRSRARRALALVLEGHLRVLHGRVVMNDLYAGDVFGAAALFGAGESYESEVVAASDCRVRRRPSPPGWRRIPASGRIMCASCRIVSGFSIAGWRR